LLTRIAELPILGKTDAVYSAEISLPDGKSPAPEYDLNMLSGEVGGIRALRNPDGNCADLARLKCSFASVRVRRGFKVLDGGYCCGKISDFDNRGYPMAPFPLTLWYLLTHSSPAQEA
jgi:hypothetical protein